PRATTAGGLPKRTRQPAARAATPAPAPADPARAPARRSPREAAAPLDAFLRGSHAAAHDHRPTSEGTPEA
ncbi:hypothetical protein, partial [Streptomyces sp. NPDC060022]|uniref:hypothetical protein n=1 Tax=Streptomyces sp. NPDC060022 TaxID=3347039 RepID=UPI0036BB0E90